MCLRRDSNLSARPRLPWATRNKTKFYIVEDSGINILSAPWLAQHKITVNVYDRHLRIEGTSDSPTLYPINVGSCSIPSSQLENPPFVAHCLMHELCAEPNISGFQVTISVNFGPDTRVETLLPEYAQFFYFTGGMPPRGTEIQGLTWRNSIVRRNVFMQDGLIMFRLTDEASLSTLPPRRPYDHKSL